MTMIIPQRSRHQAVRDRLARHHDRNNWSTELNGATDYWQKVGGGVAAAGVGWTFLAVLRRDANSDFVVQLDDGTNNERLTVWVGAGALLAVYGRTGGAIKQHVNSVAPPPAGAGNEFLAQAYIGNNADSRVYINGVDVTVHVIGLAWAGPVGIDRIQIGAGTAGGNPLLGNIRRAAVHKGAVDPALTWAWVNKDWSKLPTLSGNPRLDHVWDNNRGRDSAVLLTDAGYVGGWDLTPNGTPTRTFGRVFPWRGQAASLDGVNDYATTAFPYTPGTDFTVACRFRQDVAGTDVIWSWNDGTIANRIQVYVDAAGSPLLKILVVIGGVTKAQVGTAACAAGSWRLATLRYIASTRQATLYLDNTLSYQGTHATALPALSTMELGIVAGAGPFDGIIGDFILCTGDQSGNRAAWVANPSTPLSDLASNVIAEYNRGGELYDTVGGTVLTNRVGTQVISLDGVNDYARINLFTPFAPASQDFTVACRFRQDVAGTDVIWSWNDGTIANRIQVYISGGNLVTVVQIGGVLEINAGIGAVTAGTWHLGTLRYVAATRQVSLWIDNTLSYQSTHTNPLPAPTLFDVGNVLVGMGGGALFDGAIGDFIICTGDQSGNIAAWVADTISPLSDLASNIVAEYNRGDERFDALGGTAVVNRANPGTYDLTLANGGFVDGNGNMAIQNGGIVTLEHPV